MCELQPPATNGGTPLPNLRQMAMILHIGRILQTFLQENAISTPLEAKENVAPILIRWRLSCKSCKVKAAAHLNISTHIN